MINVSVPEPKFEEFGYWFKYKCSDTWRILDKENNFKEVGLLFKDNLSIAEDIDVDNITSKHSIRDNFSDYQLRPEYALGRPVNLSGSSADYVKEKFIELLTGICLCRSYRNKQNPDDHRDYVYKITDWLEKTDFYDAPASTRYHESFKHGLLYHTLSVYNHMLQLYDISKFNSKVDLDSAALCCLLHDWCKINLYQPYKRNVKNEQTGIWEKVDSYKRESFPHPFGHGVASMWMANKFFRLTEEECLAIRWHMGRYNVSENEVNEYQQACEQYPLVHLIQFSDQLSITEY